MSDQGTECTSPVGRIVWGHPGKPRDKTDQQTNQPIRDQQGNTIKQYSFGIAIPKDQIAPLWAIMQQEAAKGYPQGIPGNFSWKLTDGDGVDKQGKPYSQREGYAGCYVLAINTELQAPGLFVFQNGAYRQLSNEEIKTGDFVQVGLNLKVNVPANRSHTPGLYVNPLSVLLVWEGDEIQSGYQADPNALFGQQPQQMAMPAGARPVGSGAQPQQPPMGTMPGMGAQPQMQPAPQQQYQQPAPVQQQQMQPAPQQYQQPVPVQPQMPPPATDFIPVAQPQQPVMPQGNMPGLPGPR